LSMPHYLVCVPCSSPGKVRVGELRPVSNSFCRVSLRRHHEGRRVGNGHGRRSPAVFRRRRTWPVWSRNRALRALVQGRPRKQLPTGDARHAEGGSDKAFRAARSCRSPARPIDSRPTPNIDEGGPRGPQVRVLIGRRPSGRPPRRCRSPRTAGPGPSPGQFFATGPTSYSGHAVPMAEECTTRPRGNSQRQTWGSSGGVGSRPHGPPCAGGRFRVLLSGGRRGGRRDPPGRFPSTERRKFPVLNHPI